MSTRNRYFTFGMISLWLFIQTILPVYSASLEAVTPSSTIQVQPNDKALLEKSLTLIELDQEIERIGQLHLQMEKDLIDTKHRIEKEQAGLKEQKEHMAELLRNYYTGERQSFWGIIFQMKSWTDALEVLEYAHLIFRHDQIVLESYTSTLQQLQAQQQQMKEQQQAQDDLLTNLNLQRANILSLHNEINSELASRPDADSLKRLIQEMSNYWLVQGQSLFRTYFRALADAMKDFPDMLKKSNQELSLQDMTYIVRISDQQLNEFLRSKNPMFNDMEFQFESNQVVAVGHHEGMDIMISGKYTVLQKPKNVIKFHITKLQFNGLTLPDTTARELEKRFDLGFYPQKVMSVFKANTISITKNQLAVQLELAL